jgi:spermidine synthase
MPWQHLHSAAVAGATLDLYGDDTGHFMLRANGLELMSSRAHESEDVLGDMAAKAAPGVSPRILIGGLGLGFTLEAALRARPQALITVAEISQDVIGWYRSLIAPARNVALPVTVTFAHADVRDLLVPAAFEVIALDVDNGPEAFTTPANGSLYTEAGLAQLHAALAPGGTALVWSGFESEDFTKRAAAAGFTVSRHALAVPQNPRAEHRVYALTPA